MSWCLVYNLNLCKRYEVFALMIIPLDKTKGACRDVLCNLAIALSLCGVIFRVMNSQSKGLRFEIKLCHNLSSMFRVIKRIRRSPALTTDAVHLSRIYCLCPMWKVSKACISVDGFYMEWSVWSECSTTCSSDTQQRERDCEEAKYGGQPCSTIGPAEEERYCNLRECPGNSKKPFPLFLRIKSTEI